MENVRKYRDIKLVATKARRNYLVSEPNSHKTKNGLENLLAVAMKKTLIFMNKPVYLGLSILDISKIVIYEVWCDYLEAKYWRKKAKLCYMNTDIFIVYIKNRRHLRNQRKRC